MIPAASLMLRRYGHKALEESAAPADELATADYNGQAIWRRITETVGQLANMTPPGALH